MGLDQYLYKRNEHGVDVEEIYWRKANCIHRYFTEDWREKGLESDNVTEFPVSEEDLRILVNLCNEIIQNKNAAPVLLPTMSGFFFGSTEYDDWYFEDIEFTKEEVSKVLKEPLKEGEEYYYYAWY